MSLENRLKEYPKPAEYARSYFGYLSDIFSKIDTTQIAKFIETILDARERGARIFFIGNGGSAATASHFANDLSVGTRSKGKPFKVMSLTDNAAVITAIGNDFGYEFIFQKQLQSLMQEGDVVVAISASGNSPNLVTAIEYANQMKATTVALTGFDGGKLLQKATFAVHVPSNKGEYGPVEDLHMIFDHIVYTYICNLIKNS